MMALLNTEELLIALCGLVVLSYLFSIVSRYVRVPSVLLLLFAGVGFRMITDAYGSGIVFPMTIIEALGVVGLIMIVLEAGLDLTLSRNKLKLIRNAFFAALIIFIISAGLVTLILQYFLQENWMKSFVYAIPLSIMSSSIVLPSIHPLIQQKKEFLVYEASFSDILGILVFNYFVAGDVMTLSSMGSFAGNLVISIALSLFISVLLLFIMAKTRLNIKFFLIFSLLILIYAGGKLMHLPSLVIILVFGLLINNWELVSKQRFSKFFIDHEVVKLRHLLHSITAETSFLIRTFFFLIFGYSITLDFFGQTEIWTIGGLIVVALFFVRLLYLRFFVKTNVFPETFFIPRGLITIVLFYKIPEQFKLSNFNNNILFFIILTTGVIMTLGMILYKKGPEQLVEESQFEESKNV